MAEFLGISSVAHMAVRVLEKHKGVVSMNFTAAVSSAQLCGAFWWLCTAKLSSPACHQADSDRKEAEQAWPWQQCGLAAGRRAVGSWLLQKYSVEWSWTGSALCFCLGDQEFLIPKGLCIISCFFCCCFSSITSCSYTIYSITTLWQFLPFYDMHPSNRWQPKGFQPVITMQGSFLKENKQMSRLGLMLGWQVPGNKHFVLKGTLRRSAGNSSSRASVVSHKSIVLSEAVNLKAALFPGQGTTALKFIQGFEGRSTERLRALCSCYFKILCRLCFVFAASLPLLHRDQHSRTLHDFCRFFFPFSLVQVITSIFNTFRNVQACIWGDIPYACPGLWELSSSLEFSDRREALSCSLPEPPHLHIPFPLPAHNAQSCEITAPLPSNQHIIIVWWIFTYVFCGLVMSLPWLIIIKK